MRQIWKDWGMLIFFVSAMILVFIGTWFLCSQVYCDVYVDQGFKICKQLVWGETHIWMETVR